jgi:hypothetical protein
MDAHGFGLDALLGKDAERFKTATPEDAMVFHGDEGRFAALREIPALASATSLLHAWDGHGEVRAWPPPRYHAGEILPTPSQIRALYNSGFNVLVRRVERFVPELQPICRRLEKDLGLRRGIVAVDAFCALEGTGAGAHFDGSTAFNCQLDGEKKWWLAKNPAVRHPTIGMFLGSTPPAELAPYIRGPIPDRMPADATETVAKPGSVVFLPQGSIHATETRSASFSILFSFVSDTIGDRLSKTIKKRLRGVDVLRTPSLYQRNVDGSREAAAELRAIADEIERGSFGRKAADKSRLRMVPGLELDLNRRGRSVVLRTEEGEQIADIDPDVFDVLRWAYSQRSDFRRVDAKRELSHIGPSRVRKAIDVLTESGLFENVA